MVNSIATTIEQSRRLMELGIDINTADMFYVCDKNTAGEDYFSPTPSTREMVTHFGLFKNDLPSWSLSALMKLLPSEFTTENDLGIFKHEIKIRKYKFTNDVDLYQIAYGSIKFDVDGQYSFKDMIGTGEKEELLDAAFEMVCWLKENGKI